ncbi:GOLPH3/VPS74 family protein [Cohnella zeiphila]|uniref:GPP34 family phosphoprotein n=1 Tax=Cohnella zeiphila TaxID=2761120 RepID=A0A7X0SPI9_9BACL|nr:GPP34 family phosphoprotein [Cohnella zeiphila]MBB6733714.1 GPP34 family phosphoprotein [Cohnella zeiphila]
MTHAPLTLAQEFVLLASDRETHKRKKPAKSYLHTYAAGAVLIELLSEEIVRINDKGKVEAARHEAVTDDAAALMLDLLERRKPQTLKKWIQSFYSQSKVRSALFRMIVDPLVASGAMTEESYQVMLLFPASRYVPTADSKNRIVERIRAELLENGPVDRQTALLALMLEMSKLVRNYFSEYEGNELKARLARLHEEQGEQWKSIRQIRKAMEELNAVMVSAAVSASV